MTNANVSRPARVVLGSLLAALLLVNNDIDAQPPESTATVRVSAVAARHLPLEPGTAPTVVTTASWSTAVDSSRPRNGATVVRRGPDGRGSLVVRNGTGHDAAVTLARGGRAVRTTYVRTGHRVRVTGIADGTYTVYVHQGDRWSRADRSFTRNTSYRKFTTALPYKTRRDANRISYPGWSVTLHPVKDGNLRDVPVRPGELPR